MPVHAYNPATIIVSVSRSATATAGKSDGLRPWRSQQNWGCSYVHFANPGHKLPMLSSCRNNCKIILWGAQASRRQQSQPSDHRAAHSHKAMQKWAQAGNMGPRYSWCSRHRAMTCSKSAYQCWHRCTGGTISDSIRWHTDEGKCYMAMGSRAENEASYSDTDLVGWSYPSNEAKCWDPQFVQLQRCYTA
jgi:hypothetical protein